MLGRLLTDAGANRAVASGRPDDRPGGEAAQRGGVSYAPIAQGLYIHGRAKAVVAPETKGIASGGKNAGDEWITNRHWIVQASRQHGAQAPRLRLFLPRLGAMGL